MANWRGYGYTFFHTRTGDQTQAFSFDADRGSASMEGTIDVHTGDMSINVARAFLGSSEIATVAGTTIRYISRTVPHSIGDVFASHVTGRDFLYLTSIRGMKALGKVEANSGGVAEGDRIRFGGLWNALPYQVLGDNEVIGTAGLGNNIPDESLLKRYVVQTFRPSAQYLTLPRGYMKFAEGVSEAKSIPEGVGKIFPSSTWTIKWMAVPEAGVMSRMVNPGIDPFKAYLDLAIGKVNRKAWHGYPQGSLLLQSVEMEPQTSPWGGRTWNLTFTIGVNFNLWNRVYWPPAAAAGYTNEGGPPGFVRLSADGAYYTEDTAPDGRLIYDPYPLENIFQVY